MKIRQKRVTAFALFSIYQGNIAESFGQKKNASFNRRSSGGPGGIRTHDLCVANAALSQLSYKPEYNKTMP